MKGKSHIFIGIIILGLAISLYVWIGFHFLNSINPLMVFLGTYLYIVGLVLPDSDSDNKGSYIYYTGDIIFAYICRFLERPISSLLNMPVGHRQSLHTIRGIALTSFFIIVLIAIIFLLFGIYFNFGSYIFIFLMLFFGQAVHLLCDRLCGPIRNPELYTT